VLASLPCDIFLGAHGEYYSLAEKYPKLAAGVPNPFIDPQGYVSYVTERKAAFEAELAKQSAGQR
jgi:metallo-beta-lactamase class B